MALKAFEAISSASSSVAPGGAIGSPPVLLQQVAVTLTRMSGAYVERSSGPRTKRYVLIMRCGSTTYLPYREIAVLAPLTLLFGRFFSTLDQ